MTGSFPLKKTNYCQFNSIVFDVIYRHTCVYTIYHIVHRKSNKHTNNTLIHALVVRARETDMQLTDRQKSTWYNVQYCQ